MKRLLSIVVVVAGVVALGIAVTASAGGPPRDRDGRHGSKTIRVIEHATTDATTDTGASGDSAGDILTFANEVFDSGDDEVVGTNQGYCIRVVVGVSYECTWTTFLDRGQIVVAGPFYDAKDSTMAITGGTGKYRKASGTMELSSLEGGTKYSMVFKLRR